MNPDLLSEWVLTGAVVAIVGALFAVLLELQ